MTQKCYRCRRPLPRRRESYKETAQCRRCLNERRDYELFVRTGVRIDYTPLDEVLASPLVRLLRGLRRFGWIEVGELFDVLGAPEDHHEPERAALSKALSRAVAVGLIERMACRAFIATPGRPNGRDHNWYRITAAGLAELERRLAVDNEIAADEAEGDVAA